MTYYAVLERIFSLELFFSKIQGNMLDTVKLEHAVLNGLPFWNNEPQEGTQQPGEEAEQKLSN